MQSISFCLQLLASYLNSEKILSKSYMLFLCFFQDLLEFRIIPYVQETVAARKGNYRALAARSESPVGGYTPLNLTSRTA